MTKIYQAPLETVSIKKPLPTWQSVRQFFDRFVPRALSQDIETNRRANLLIGFGFLGGAFGSVFGVFYLLIGHYWGSLVVFICSGIFAATPYLLRQGVSFALCANLISLTMISGFTVLCALEGGLRGHAIAWIVSVPLCALLLLSNQRAAYIWCGISVLAAGLFVLLDFRGIRLQPSYPVGWETTVSAAGYIALILFMFSLGVIFETNRVHALERMRETLLALEHANAKLAQLNADKSEFLSMAAHDVKNPLGIIIGTAETIRAVAVQPDTPLAVETETIIRAAVHARNLVSMLLDAEAVEQGRMPMKIERCDLGAIVNEVRQTNEAVAIRKGILLELTPAPEPDSSVKADPAQLRQILENFLSNAIKFSPKGKKVYLGWYRRDHEICIDVRDEGPGLSKFDQLKLFSKFARLSARPTANESSHGLGLFMAKKMAESMSGRVYCISTAGHGATFGVRLPAA